MEQLRKLLDRAADKGRGEGVWHRASTAELLFGFNLSFLQALVGSGQCCHLCGTANANRHAGKCSAAGLSYANRTYWFATRLVVMPDEKRIPWLHDYIFKENSQ